MEVTKYQGYLQTHMKNQELIGMLPATAAELVALENGKNVEEAYKEQSNITYTTKTEHFAQGETVFDFATKNFNTTKFVVSNGGTLIPNDLPIKAEGWVTVIADTPSSSRKRVIFKPYLTSQYEYYREMFGGVWRNDWKEILTVDNTPRKTVATYSIGASSSQEIKVNVGKIYFVTCKLIDMLGTELMYTGILNFVNQHAKNLTDVSRLNFGSDSSVSFTASNHGFTITNSLSSTAKFRVFLMVVSE